MAELGLALGGHLGKKIFRLAMFMKIKSDSSSFLWSVFMNWWINSKEIIGIMYE